MQPFERKQVTDLEQLFQELDGGAFGQRVGLALSDTALGVVSTGKVGEVTIKFKVKPIGQSTQVQIDHVVSYSQPTDRGKRGEEHGTSTAMYVGPRGKLTILNNETGNLFDKNKEADTTGA